MTRLWVLIGFILFSLAAQANIDDETPIVIRGPASEGLQANPRSTARVIQLIDNKTLKAVSNFSDWHIGEVIVLESQTPGVGIVGFVEVTGIENKQDGTFEIMCELLRQSRTSFIQIGDEMTHLDLSTGNERYKGTTDLIIKEEGKKISAKYRPLFTQGFTAGETAQTLWQDEYMLTWFGQVNYGVKSWLTASTIVPGFFAGAANAAFKAKLYDSVSNVVSTGLSYAKIPNQTASSLNLNIFWDSISSESTISHTFVSIALYSFDNAENATVIKSLGTSSLQSGYELILTNWDRVLLGPSYNFENKTVGGYLTYLKIWDRFHLGASLTSTDITEFTLFPSGENANGYFVSFDAYWRF